MASSQDWARERSAALCRYASAVCASIPGARSTPAKSSAADKPHRTRGLLLRIGPFESIPTIYLKMEKGRRRSGRPHEALHCSPDEPPTELPDAHGTGAGDVSEAVTV